jgi:hypothetical protein
VPGPFGNIDQRILGRSIAAEIALYSREAAEVIPDNAAMKILAASFNTWLLEFLCEVQAEFIPRDTTDEPHSFELIAGI